MFNALYFSGGLIQSRQISCIISVVIYSYHFIAKSTSYLNAAGFWIVFSVPVISRIESIGGGRVGGCVVGGGGGWGAVGGLKYPFKLKEKCYAISM